jgi:periplasmic protein TonB
MKLIQTDYLETDKLIGARYGALILRKDSDALMAKSMAASIAIFFGLVLCYLGATTILSQAPPVAIPKVTASFIVSSAALDALPEPPPAARAKPRQAQPTSGVITPSRDIPKEKPNETSVRTDNAPVTNMSVETHSTTGGTDGNAESLTETGTAGNSGSEEVFNPDGIFETAEINPAFVNRVNPVFPENARRLGVEGKTVVRVLVDKTGKPLRASILKTSSELFDEAAVSAVMRSTFTPAKQNGLAVACWLTIPFSFKLH